MPPRTLTLAVAQFRPKKGDYQANLALVVAALAQADRMTPRPEVVQFPESALSGYFVEGGVRDIAVTAGQLARDLDREYRRAASSGEPVDVVIGFYESWRDTLYNSAMCATLGGDAGGPEVHHVHRKNFLPTYGMFDEERFVERGLTIRAFDRPWGRAAILVCEDAWHSLSGTVAALDGADLIFISSAAPARGIWPRDDGVPGPASVARWERLSRDIAEEHGVFVALSNLVGSEGGKMFGGSSTVVGPKGDVRARAPMLDEAMVVLDIDFGDLLRARADTPMLSDLRVALPHLRRVLDDVDAGIPAEAAWDDGATERDAIVEVEATPGSTAGGTERAAPAADARRGSPPEKQNRAGNASAPERRPAAGTSLAAAPLLVVNAAPRDHGIPAPLAIDPELTERWLVRFLRDELGRRGFEKAVFGLSGGVDSAVTAYLAARALGPGNVVGIRLPYRTSSPESLQHAQLVGDALGIELRTVDISAAVDGYLANEPDADGARRGNVMARMRMIAVFDLSARYRALPLGTGNKTERLFGYFTWHADDSPPVNPLGDLFKTQVWALARHLGVPEVIVGKPASADLISGQTDEGDFGISYAKADEILNWLLHGYGPDGLAARGFDAAEVALVRRRLEGTHWKRKLPTVAMVSPTAIGESYLRPVDY